MQTLALNSTLLLRAICWCSSNCFGDENMFDKNHIKLMSYNNYYKLNRLQFIKRENEKFYYKNTFNDTVVVSERRIKTVDDYKGYLVLVY
ncbi:hypothetical protein [Orgyia leucostigma nucleopolyhedrovirus]|uniref:Uncharacterized protein n=1 Tax=Orgyia leucostigma nucleopolyhedrovirus TaxID=490711 RepID=B0FDQ7_9ABAC|nr:hypothetical protein [Orgyia leucostigma nucleopolyhedrovirus]ABY65765.1 hypothetical protein [Orgyia leucostigma nucleopolyhedrovirus]